MGVDGHVFSGNTQLSFGQRHKKQSYCAGMGMDKAST